jgi:hypothetical protein
MVTPVTKGMKGGTQKLPQKFMIVETYWHDHSLESSWGALSDGTISSSIQPFLGEKCIFCIKTSVVNRVVLHLLFVSNWKGLENTDSWTRLGNVYLLVRSVYIAIKMFYRTYRKLNISVKSSNVLFGTICIVNALYQHWSTVRLWLHGYIGACLNR